MNKEEKTVVCENNDEEINGCIMCGYDDDEKEKCEKYKRNPSSCKKK